MTELRHRLDGGLVGDIPDDLAPAGVDRDELLRSRRLVFGEPPSAGSDELTEWMAKAMTDAAPDEDDDALDNRRASAPLFGHWSDPAERNAAEDTDSYRVTSLRADGTTHVRGDHDDESEPATDPIGLPVQHPDRSEPHHGDVAPRDATEVLGEPDPPAAAPADGGTPMLPALYDPAFGSPVTRPAGQVPTMARDEPPMELPAEPTLVLDADDRILLANPAGLRLAGLDPDPCGGDADVLTGVPFAQLVTGPDDAARLLQPDGGRLSVQVVRWSLPASRQTVVLLLERERPAAAPHSEVDARWIAELERMLRLGRWSYELESGRLHRTDSLEQLYRSVGVDPQGPVVEHEQIGLLRQALNHVDGPRRHHMELPLSGAGTLSCQAEVEFDADGDPVRIVGVVRDLNSDPVPAAGLGLSGQRFADLMAMVPGGVALIDPTGRIVDANPGLCALLDVSLEELRGASAALLGSDSATPYPDALGPIDSGPVALPEWLRPVPIGARHGYRVGDVALRRRDGTPVWCELAVSATAVDDGGWLWLVLCTDVSERRRAAELLRSAGTVDELTRLPNRAAIVVLVDKMLAGPARDRVAVVCGDIDDFQRVNSSLGHEAGDDLLVMLAGRLQRDLPVGCTAARLSGDEFMVICSDHAEVGGPDVLARTVADLLSSTLNVAGRPVQLTASVGVATPTARGEVRAADLLRFAEAAMHDAKRRQSRGGIGMATDGMVNSALHALELEAELRAAIATGGLILEYQPVVGPDGTVLSAEALVRWPHPMRGLIPPSEFLPVAQRSGLLRELDLWVLRTATREAASWPEHQGRRPSIAVNLAGLLPADIDFLPIINDIVLASGLAFERLVLELVETSLVALPPHARAAMAQLVARGVRFAVDDFGTGYSSLGRLKELPAQTVKVDRAFVTDIADDPVDFAVARAVVDMARAMGRSTVAEGVETAEQFHRLRSIGVDAYQGWLFAKALPPAELRQLLPGDRMSTPENVRAGL